MSGRFTLSLQQPWSIIKNGWSLRYANEDQQTDTLTGAKHWPDSVNLRFNWYKGYWSKKEGNQTSITSKVERGGNLRKSSSGRKQIWGKTF